MKLLFKVIDEPVNTQHSLVIPTTMDICVCGQSTIKWSEIELCVSLSVHPIGHNWICLRLTTFIQVKEGRHFSFMYENIKMFLVGRLSFGIKMICG